MHVLLQVRRVRTGVVIGEDTAKSRLRGAPKAPHFSIFQEGALRPGSFLQTEMKGICRRDIEKRRCLY